MAGPRLNEKNQQLENIDPPRPTRRRGARAQKRLPFWLTQELMAQACGISVAAFQRWGVEPVARIGRYSFYLVSDVLTNRLERQAARQQAASAPPATDHELTRSEREEKLRLTRAQAEGQELKNAQLRKELAPVDVIEWVLGKVGGEISAILESIPALLKKRNAKLTASNIELIRREIVKAQNAASQITVNLDDFYGTQNKD